jgi:hypothetical protein
VRWEGTVARDSAPARRRSAAGAFGPPAALPGFDRPAGRRRQSSGPGRPRSFRAVGLGHDDPDGRARRRGPPEAGGQNEENGHEEGTGSLARLHASIDPRFHPGRGRPSRPARRPDGRLPARCRARRAPVETFCVVLERGCRDRRNPDAGATRPKPADERSERNTHLTSDPETTARSGLRREPAPSRLRRFREQEVRRNGASAREASWPRPASRP